MRKGFYAVPWLLLAGSTGAWSQVNSLALVAQHAEAFQRNAIHTLSVETLLQTSLRYPLHAHVTIGASPEILTARFFTNEIVSDYTIGRIKGAANLLEVRELVSMNGNAIQTPEVARRALALDIRSGEARIRRRILSEFTRLGLVDVATDYALILLAFTRAGQLDLRVEPAGEGFVGTEEVFLFQWQQMIGNGNALEFRGGKVNRRALQGQIWIRKSDGMPLRISASFGHPESGHVLRDEASVDYVSSALGFPAPITVAHRHYVDGQCLTENLYTYAPFRVFTSDTNIRYTDTPEPPAKK